MKRVMRDSFIKKVMAVILGIGVVALIVWNVAEANLLIVGINK